MRWTGGVPVAAGRWRLTGPGISDATFYVSPGGGFGAMAGVFSAQPKPGAPVLPLICAGIRPNGLEALIEADGTFSTLVFDGPPEFQGRFVSATAAEGQRATRDSEWCFGGPRPFTATLEAADPPPAVGGRQLLPFNPEPVDYVALGDSYSSGEGAGKYIDDTGGRRGCHRSARAYPQLLELPGFTFIRRFFACSGAVTDNVTTIPQQARPPEPAPQLDRISREEWASVDLVTISIGGNNARFSDVIRQCAVFACQKGDRRARILNRVDETREEVAATYAEIRARAPKATVVVLSYPNLFPAAGQNRKLCSTGPTTLARQLFVNEVAQRLRDRLHEAASDAGLLYADVAPSFAGHEPCGPEEQWIFGLQPGTDLGPIGSESYHPTPAGQAAYAAVLRSYFTCLMGARWPLTAARLPANPILGRRPPPRCTPG